jgi:hypothetical protein
VSGREQPDLLPISPTDPARQRVMERRTAVHAADRIGAEHPTQYDDDDPRRAGRTVAHDPEARAGLLLLLDALGLTPATHRRTA